jgi:hypothetical protein
VYKHTLLKNKEGIDLHVFHNGIDVTNRCQAFDDEYDYANLLKHRNGRPYIDTNTGYAAKETVHGFVVKVYRCDRVV